MNKRYLLSAWGTTFFRNFSNEVYWFCCFVVIVVFDLAATNKRQSMETEKDNIQAHMLPQSIRQQCCRVRVEEKKCIDRSHSKRNYFPTLSLCCSTRLQYMYSVYLIQSSIKAIIALSNNFQAFKDNCKTFSNLYNDNYRFELQI